MNQIEAAKKEALDKEKKLSALWEEEQKENEDLFTFKLRVEFERKCGERNDKYELTTWGRKRLEIEEAPKKAPKKEAKEEKEEKEEKKEPKKRAKK